MKIDANYLAAGAPSTSPIELQRLACLNDQRIELRLAENHVTPENILLALSTHPNPEIRAAVATNESSPLWLKAALSADESPTVRYAIAEDLHSPPEILQALTEDSNAYVQHQARATLDSLELESALSEAGFAQKSGETFLLGTLLVDAGLLQPSQLFSLLKLTLEMALPLGQVIARRKLLPKKTIVSALLIQSALRNGSITEEEAIQLLRKRPKKNH